jgi:hypothetical protein
MYPLHLDAGTTRRWTTLRADGMPVQIARRVGSVAGQRSGAPEHGRYGRLLADRGCATVDARADWLGFAGGARAVAGASDGNSFPRE